MVLVKGRARKDTGKVVVGRAHRIACFREKAGAGREGYDNAGVYAMRRDIFSRMGRRRKFSLENDLFPALPGRLFFGFVQSKSFVDIGTPRRYKEARKILRNRHL